MAPLEKIEVSLIATVANCGSLRVLTIARLAALMLSSAICEQAGGFIHPAPIGSGRLDARDLKAFHETSAILRTSTGAPDLSAFWLVALQCDCDVAFDVEAHADLLETPTGTVDAIAYSWLFIQPSAVIDLVWHQAGATLSQRFSQTVLCRDRNETVLSTYAGSERGSGSFSAADETLEAIVANAMPGSSRVADQSGCSPSRKQSLYAAVPHCNSSRMMFAYKGIWKGDE